MSHEGAEFEQLSAFLDGRLSPDEARAVQERLEESEQYRELHDQLASARSVLRSTRPPAVPEGLLEDIKREAETHMQPSGSPGIWARWRVPVGAIAAAAAVLLAVFSPWQALHEDEDCEICPPTSQPAAVAEAPMEEPQPAVDEPAETAPVAVAQAPESETEPAAASAGETQIAARPATPATRASRPAATAAPAPEPAGEPAEPAAQPDETPEEPVESEPLPEPQIAAVPSSTGVSAASAGPVLSEPSQPTVLARAPRTTIDDEPTLEPVVPDALETEMATGVVAGMVLDQFIAEHMVESSATMLSVVTDTPTSELGPAIADEDDEAGSFGFSFTDAMRRALTESENQLP